ncbi:MAG: hypothetical protein ACFFDI_21135, partial [Promethearchaeota archaeon]
VDPTAESFLLAKILKEELTKMKKKFWFVINKVTPETAELVMSKARDMGLEVAGVVRFDGEVFKSSLEGVPLNAKEALIDITAILREIQFI